MCWMGHSSCTFLSYLVNSNTIIVYNRNILLSPVVWLMLLLCMNVSLESVAGELRQDKGVSQPQPEEGVSRMRALELELAMARQAKE